MSLIKMLLLLLLKDLKTTLLFYQKKKDKNRSLERDVVVLRLIDPKYWDPLRESKSGADNEKPIERRIIDEERTDQLVGEGIQSEDKKAEESKVDSSAADDEQKAEGDDSNTGNETPLQNDEDNMDTTDKDEAKGEELKDEGEGNEDEKSEEESENDKSIVQLLKERKAQNFEKRGKYLEDKDNGLKIPSSVNSQQLLIEWINTVAVEYRPKAKVVYIKESSSFEKDVVMILKFCDKNIKFIPKYCKATPEEKLKIVENAKENISGFLKENRALGVPINKKLKWGFIDSLPDEFWNDVLIGADPCKRYYLCKYISWKSWMTNPSAVMIKTLGSAGDIEAETLRILKQYDLFELEYPSEVLESLKYFNENVNQETKEWKIPEEEIKKRIDLRDTRIFTIDPITAKDLDDALSIKHIEDDIYEVGVHIADVSYFVEQGTALDKEARSRATSVYFVHLVIPMLPPLLCENLCSLNQKVERLAYSCIFRIKLDGSLVTDFKPVIHRSVIKSCAKWNYELVQDILDKKVTCLEDIDEHLRPETYSFEEMSQDCFIMNEIAQNRRKWRFDNGSISVSNPEYFFELNEDSLPTQFSEVKKIKSKELVEEYMLLANLFVAEYLVEHCKDKAVLRTQLPPKEEKVEDMIKYFLKVKADVDISTSLSTQKSFEKLMNSPDIALYYCCMRKYFSNIREANYVTRGIEDKSLVRHYSLNFDLYTHFTSPIRRYPDLLVHRQLTLALEHQEKTREIMENIDYQKFVEYCSDRYLTAKYASSTCTKLYHCIFLKNTQTREGVDAYVYDMNRNSIFFYIASINVNYKMDFRRDPRISSYYVINDYTAYLMFKSEEDLANQNDNQEIFEDQGYDFKNIETEQEFLQLKEKIEKDEKLKDKLMKIEILEVVKLAVGTTNEIPIDLKCLIFRNDADFDRVKDIKEDEDATEQKSGPKKFDKRGKNKKFKNRE